MQQCLSACVCVCVWERERDSVCVWCKIVFFDMMKLIDFFVVDKEVEKEKCCRVTLSPFQEMAKKWQEVIKNLKH